MCQDREVCVGWILQWPNRNLFLARRRNIAASFRM